MYRPEGVFDFIYARDSAKGLLKLGLSGYEGVINLGTGRSRRVAELVEILRKHFPNMISEEVASDIPFEASQADLTELRKAINWVPEEDLETTIPDIIAFEKSREEGRSFIPPNVLITSISKKVPLIKAVSSGVQKVSASSKIFGADVDATCIGRYFVDVFWHMPKLNALRIEDLIAYCKIKQHWCHYPNQRWRVRIFRTPQSNAC